MIWACNCVRCVRSVSARLQYRWRLSMGGEEELIRRSWAAGSSWWATAGSRAWRARDHVVVAVAMLANVVEATFYVVR